MLKSKQAFVFVTSSIADFLATGPNFSYCFHTDKKKSSTQIIVNSITWRVEWHYMCLTIRIFFTLSKNTQSDSWGLFTSSHHIRAESRPASLWNGWSKAFEKSCTLDTGKFNRTELVLARAVNSHQTFRHKWTLSLAQEWGLHLSKSEFSLHTHPNNCKSLVTRCSHHLRFTQDIKKNQKVI